VFDLSAAATRAGADADASLFASMLSLIDADDPGLDVARGLLEKRGGEADLWLQLTDVALLAPLPQPRQMRDGMSFATHIRQSARGGRAVQAMKAGGLEAFKAAMAAPLGELPAIYRQIPITYITNRQTVVGPGATVRWPRYSKVMDYELEVAAITKRTRANIPASEGDQHIFG
jgi:2-keto-4-pentenoate hydratase/2-oxohepta-3-ene-1,7-dioic acid hydratase in catechol pathway